MRYPTFGFKKCWSVVLVFLLAAALITSVPRRPAAASGYTLPPSAQLRAVAYGNGAYVVIGDYSAGDAPGAYGSTILTSPDGSIWTVQPASSNPIDLDDIAYGNGVFVAVGRMSRKSASDIGSVLTSSDGVHWSTSNFDMEFYSIAYGNDKFVLLGYENNYTSADGVTWTPMPNHALYIAQTPRLIFSNGVFTDFSSGTQFATSTDGVNWQEQDMGIIDYSGTGTIFPSIVVTGAAYGDGMYVVAGTYTQTNATGEDFYPVVITSPDGVKWTMTRLDSLHHLESIAYGNGIFMATGADGGILTSADGLNWTAASTVNIPVDSEISKQAVAAYGEVFFCNGKFVALGDGGMISTSPDGINWTNNRSSYQAVFTVGQSNYVLNGQTCPTDAAPFIQDDRMFVPVRYLGDALGVAVGWSGNPGDQTVPLTRNTSPTADFGVTLTIGSTMLTYQGSGVSPGSTRMMDTAPLIRNGRAYLPVRYLAEAFGYTVAWDPASQTVTINEPQNITGQTALSTLPASIQSLTIGDDTPGIGLWIPQDQNSVISQISAWLQTATPYTEAIPTSAKVFLMDYLGPSRLDLKTSNGQNISLYPAYYYTKTPQAQDGSYLVQVNYVQE